MALSSSHSTHVLAAFVHGGLAAGHALGLLYNSRRPQALRNRVGLMVHAAALLYSGWAVVHHWRAT